MMVRSDALRVRVDNIWLAGWHFCSRLLMKNEVDRESQPYHKGTFYFVVKLTKLCESPETKQHKRTHVFGPPRASLRRLASKDGQMTSVQQRRHQTCPRWVQLDPEASGWKKSARSVSERCENGEFADRARGLLFSHSCFMWLFIVRLLVCTKIKTYETLFLWFGRLGF